MKFSKSGFFYCANRASGGWGANLGAEVDQAAWTKDLEGHKLRKFTDRDGGGIKWSCYP